MSRLIPDLKESFAACRRRSERVTRRVGGFTAFVGPLARYRPHEAAYEAVYAAWRAAKYEASVALGLQHDAETELDNEMRMVAFVLRAVDGGAVRSVRVQTVFPGGYGRVLGKKGVEALNIAKGVLRGIEEDAHRDVIARREPLKEAMAALVDAIEARDAAFVALARARAALYAARTRWRRAFIAFYFECVNVFPEKRRFVNNLFRVSVTRHVEDEADTEAETEEEADTEAEAGAPEADAGGPEAEAGGLETEASGPGTGAGGPESGAGGPEAMGEAAPARSSGLLTAGGPSAPAAPITRTPLAAMGAGGPSPECGPSCTTPADSTEQALDGAPGGGLDGNGGPDDLA